MKSLTTLFAMLALLLISLPARAQIDQAKPGETAAQPNPHAALNPDSLSAEEANAQLYARQNRAAFERSIHLDRFRLLAIQHLDQVKILDSWARQSLRKMRHRESIDGQDCLYTALDMAFRPEAWMNSNIIYVQSVPLREELGHLAPSAAEAQRIREEALVSPAFLLQDPVMDRLKDLSNDSRQLDGVNKTFEGLETFLNMEKSLNFLPPPPTMRTTPWVNPADVAQAVLATNHLKTPDQATALATAYTDLQTGWQGNDVAAANRGIDAFLSIAPSIDAAGYPSITKRTVELWYNRTFSGTLVAFIYFAAMVLFFLVAVGITRRVEKTALAIYGVALACHITAMAIRWWLDGRIPIQNEFESILGSACVGCTVGFLLELWRKNGIFGAAFGMVGFLAATSLLAAPYVFGNDLGSAPGKVAGILNTYWLYIHVNIVIASYSLIFASAAIALIYLGMRQWHWINPIEPGFSEGAPDGNPGLESGESRPGPARSPSTPALALATADVKRVTTQRAAALETLDQCNMVVLQMAFWFLGIGIMCGAVWADQSWGRPWGWDPKETFALVTWIVYLVIVHLRLVIKHKADWTAILAVAGCGVMLFNWIGVNFFLKGLHSYA